MLGETPIPTRVVPQAVQEVVKQVVQEVVKQVVS
jgi:hypothetical protein